ncbi:RNA polymerase sigma factor, sigma-70 family [Aliicoccus persicus]|uniref:RNA polymerase sigma factor SigS n=2 Tax=Aliicoccus persicus TaxID=930138 RepID=A0A662Z3X9_9STAP|nr:RNA polymerase sigma factor, sigma-70 family [Aliicoccus persicus]
MVMSDRVMQYERMVYSWIHKLGISVDMDDFAQIGRLAVYEGLKKSDVDDKLVEASLIYGLIRNRLIDEIRRRGKLKLEVTGDESMLDGVDDTSNDVSLWLHDAKLILNDVEYRCVQMMLRGYTQQEIGQRIGKSRSTVKFYQQNIRKKLSHLR